MLDLWYLKSLRQKFTDSCYSAQDRTKGQGGAMGGMGGLLKTETSINVHFYLR